MEDGPRTDGWAKIRTERMEEWTNWRTDWQKVGQRMNGWKVVRIGGISTDRWSEERSDGRTERQMRERAGTDERADGVYIC